MTPLWVPMRGGLCRPGHYGRRDWFPASSGHHVWLCPLRWKRHLPLPMARQHRQCRFQLKSCCELRSHSAAPSFQLAAHERPGQARPHYSHVQPFLSPQAFFSLTFCPFKKKRGDNESTHKNVTSVLNSYEEKKKGPIANTNPRSDLHPSVGTHRLFGW